MKDDWVEGARDYVREHPIAALGIAAAAGYVLSMIMRCALGRERSRREPARRD